MNVKQIILETRPSGKPTAANFGRRESALPALRDGDVALKALYFSVDPYMRGRMNDAKSYVAPFQVGEPIAGGVVAEVIESRSSDLKNGDLVVGMLPWATFCVAPAQGLKQIDPKLAPPSYFLGVLGMPGMTAYFGLLDIGRPKPGETVVVSGAAGAVGIVVGQIAKIKGCHVVGIAGSEEKVALLRTEFGFDEALNYRTEKNLSDAISKACPKGVDVYFENVGGDIGDAVISNLNNHARIPLCGQIALYNATEAPSGPRLQPILLSRRGLMQGFIVSDYESRYDEGVRAIAGWIKEGRIKFTETIVNGFDNLPQALIGLFSGENTGKMIVKA